MLTREDQNLAEQRLERLISHLPRRMAAFVRWARHPDRVWLRAPLGILLVIGGCFAILPILGVWMIPLGVILLAQDFAPARRVVHRLVNWTAERRPRWFGEQPV